jgi:hypothetical protein
MALCGWRGPPPARPRSVRADDWDAGLEEGEQEHFGVTVIALLGALESAYQVRQDLSRLTNLHFAADE